MHDKTRLAVIKGLWVVGRLIGETRVPRRNAPLGTRDHVILDTRVDWKCFSPDWDNIKTAHLAIFLRTFEIICAILRQIAHIEGLDISPPNS